MCASPWSAWPAWRCWRGGFSGTHPMRSCGWCPDATIIVFIALHISPPPTRCRHQVAVSNQPPTCVVVRGAGAASRASCSLLAFGREGRVPIVCLVTNEILYWEHACVHRD
jgi:hypothetical protein